jgi:hypothetical protein
MGDHHAIDEPLQEEAEWLISKMYPCGGDLMNQNKSDHAWAENAPAAFPELDRRERFLEACPQIEAIFI